MNNARGWFKVVGFYCLCLALSSGALGAAETNSAVDLSSRSTEAAVSSEAFRAYLQLEQQIREAQLEIERTRRDAENAAAKNTEMLATRLESIEQAMAHQREAMQSTGKFMLVVLSIFAGAGFIGIVLTAFFQWRTVNRLADFSASVPSIRPAALLQSPEDSQLMGAAGQVEQTNHRLFGAVERLEKRIHELEHATRAPLGDHVHDTNGNGHGGDNGLEPGQTVLPLSLAAAEPHPDQPGQIKLLLDQGQQLLNSDQPEAAVLCFDEALSLDPSHTEALVKKGAALERMRKLPEAIECYDRAIAVDGSMTIAYLYKGGLYNRMERFSEAVECYEQALRTQEKRSA